MPSLDRAVAACGGQPRVQVPEPWRAEFVAWIRTTFDNDLPAEHFVWFDSSPEDLPAQRDELGGARLAWAIRV